MRAERSRRARGGDGAAGWAMAGAGILWITAFSLHEHLRRKVRPVYLSTFD